MLLGLAAAVRGGAIICIVRTQDSLQAPTAESTRALLVSHRGIDFVPQTREGCRLQAAGRRPRTLSRLFVQRQKCTLENRDTARSRLEQAIGAPPRLSRLPHLPSRSAVEVPCCTGPVKRSRGGSSIIPRALEPLSTTAVHLTTLALCISAVRPPTAFGCLRIIAQRARRPSLCRTASSLQAAGVP
ncbi:hypothetical protein AC579_629 [Pseudocercospora musae]|uniref:Uncharacterized protein n=1 Tax=Pseudocercospora musae TaxID=113226 RepID=A0A139HPQ9_9PEZI|nr:hypothetical protein AC579_629 [Pseudocercospora musae]